MQKLMCLSETATKYGERRIVSLRIITQVPLFVDVTYGSQRHVGKVPIVTCTMLNSFFHLIKHERINENKDVRTVLLDLLDNFLLRCDFFKFVHK